MFHVGNFTPNFHWGLNPGPLAPLASILPLRHKVKELPGPKIWKVIDLGISLVFRQIEQLQRYGLFNYVRVLAIFEHVPILIKTIYFWKTMGDELWNPFKCKEIFLGIIFLICITFTVRRTSVGTKLVLCTKCPIYTMLFYYVKMPASSSP